MEEENKNNNFSKGEIWWKPAMEIFSEISAWIAMPIILALIAGKALDKRYGTEPWLLLALAVVGFMITSFGIVRAVKKYAKKIKNKK